MNLDGVSKHSLLSPKSESMTSEIEPQPEGERKRYKRTFEEALVTQKPKKYAVRY